MKLNKENPTASELIDWGKHIFGERVSAEGLDLTDEAEAEFHEFCRRPALILASRPRYFRLHWQNFHRLARDLGSLSASSAVWAKRSTVDAEDVVSALSAYQFIKPALTSVCSRAADLDGKVAETAVA